MSLSGCSGPVPSALRPLPLGKHTAGLYAPPPAHTHTLAPQPYEGRVSTHLAGGVEVPHLQFVVIVAPRHQDAALALA
jgi:hypothetical protein